MITWFRKILGIQRPSTKDIQDTGASAVQIRRSAASTIHPYSPKPTVADIARAKRAAVNVKKQARAKYEAGHYHRVRPH